MDKEKVKPPENEEPKQKKPKLGCVESEHISFSVTDDYEFLEAFGSVFANVALSNKIPLTLFWIKQSRSSPHQWRTDHTHVPGQAASPDDVH